MTMRRSAVLSRAQVAALLAVTFGGLSQLSAAAPSSSRSSPEKFPSGRRPAQAPATEIRTSPAASVRPGPQEFADALPTADPAPPDLRLPKELEKKVEALTHFAQALLLEDAADNDGALESYRKAFELDPSNSDLALKLASMLAQRNDATGGIEVLKDAIKISPKEPLPLVFLSQLYAKYLKKPEVGIKYAEQALALDATAYPPYLALFELFAATNQPARIDQLLQRALKAPSTSADFWIQIGALFQQAYIKEDGVISSPEALKQMNVLFRKAAALAENDPTVLAKVGDYFILSKQTAEAIPFYLAALNQKPAPDGRLVADVGEKLFHAYDDTGEREKAIAVLEKITTENPLRFEAFEKLGELYEKIGDTDKALTNYKHSLLLDASEPQNHIRVFYLELSKKRYDDALETARSARSNFPDNPVTIQLLAIALSEAKKHEEAMTAFAQALNEYQNGHEEMLDSRFYFTYGAAAERAGLPNKAEELLKKSIDLDPNSPGSAQTYNYLGYMWADRGEHLDEAAEMIKKAVTMDPDNGAYLDSLGWLFYKEGEYDKALQQLLRASELNKPEEDPTVMEHLGDTYQKLGKTALALQCWQKSFTLDPENKKVGEKIEAAKEKVSSNTAKPDLVAPAP